MKTVQAYRYALDLRPRDERGCRSHAGAARFAWNWGLARCAERYEAERKWYSAAEPPSGPSRAKRAGTPRTGT